MHDAVEQRLAPESLRASSHAIAMPNGSDTTVATSAIRSDSSTAVHSSGVRSNICRPLARSESRAWLALFSHDVGRIRNVKPYFSNIAFAASERRKAR